MAIDPAAGEGATGLARVGAILSHVFLDPGSTFSLASLACAFAVAAAITASRRRRRTPLRMKALLRALLPAKFFRHASSRADAWFFVLNIFGTGVLVGAALLSASSIAEGVRTLLAGTFGAAPHVRLPGWAGVTIVTVIGFIAYDFAYWLDHWIKHRFETLWAFHGVHHTAEVLTPLTAYRMHPIDSLVFFNISAIVIGLAQGVGLYVFGGKVHAATVSGVNLILVVFVFTTIHLQHSHIRLGWSGWLGRLLLSPMHHQIHHSRSPAHYGKNLGSCFAVWDWMFGTLHAPSPDDRLVFGADVGTDAPHSLRGALLHPFAMAGRSLIVAPVLPSSTEPT